MIAAGAIIGIATAASVAVAAVRATKKAMFGLEGPSAVPGLAPFDVADLEHTLARTAHLYRGFGHDRSMRMAVRALDRVGRNTPRVEAMSTLECNTLGRSTWFRLEDGTAVRIDSPIAATIDSASATDTPEYLLRHAHLVAAHRRPNEVVLHFSDAGRRIELRGSGAAIL